MRAAALDAFIDKCLEPIPDDALVDTQYNRMARDARGKAWQAAELRREYYRALYDAAHVLECGWRWGLTIERPVAVPRRDECMRLERQATLEQLLTPARRKADIDWKQRHRRRFQSDPLIEKIDAAIADDGAFLAAHPTARTGKRSGRPV